MVNKDGPSVVMAGPVQVLRESPLIFVLALPPLISMRMQILLLAYVLLRRRRIVPLTYGYHGLDDQIEH